MDELDESLRQLALEAQQHPPGNRKRQLALQKLWSMISRSGKLYPPSKERIPPSLSYEDVYNEALANLMLHICKNIDEYDPERASVLGWATFLFNKRCIGDVIRKSIRYQDVIRKSIPDIDRRFTTNSLSDLDTSHSIDKTDLADKILYSENESLLLSEMLRQCLIEDPKKLFQSTHITGYPSANFQSIALRYLDRVSWQDMSSEFGISCSTLSSFFQRKLTKFKSIIKEYIQE